MTDHSERRRHAARLLPLRLFALLLVAPAAGWAQGGVPGGRSDDGRLQYNMMVNDGVTRLVQQWETACNQRDPATVAALYLRNAMIVGSTGSIVNGTEGLRDYFAKNLPRLSGFRLGFYEIVASGDLAYLTGYLTYDVLYPTGGTYPASVPYSLALVQQRNGTWLIRAQTGGDFPASVAIQDDLRPGLTPGESDSVRVQVTDATGKPIAHTQVAFEVEYGEGTVSPVTVLTNDSGEAGAEITTAPEPGINVVLARAVPLLQEPLAFRVVTGEVAAAESSRPAASLPEPEIAARDARSPAPLAAPAGQPLTATAAEFAVQPSAPTAAHPGLPTVAVISASEAMPVARPSREMVTRSLVKRKRARRNLLLDMTPILAPPAERDLDVSQFEAQPLYGVKWAPIQPPAVVRTNPPQGGRDGPLNSIRASGANRPVDAATQAEQTFHQWQGTQVTDSSQVRGLSTTPASGTGSPRLTSVRPNGEHP